MIRVVTSLGIPMMIYVALSSLPRGWALRPGLETNPQLTFISSETLHCGCLHNKWAVDWGPKNVSASCVLAGDNSDSERLDCTTAEHAEASLTSPPHVWTSDATGKLCMACSVNTHS